MKEILIIPVLNVDGYEHTHLSDRLWRKNRRNNGFGIFGVDLNRNWNCSWSDTGGASTFPFSDTYK